MTKFGQIQEFEPDNESFSTYIECLELIFEANDVPDEKRIPVLLSIIGAKICALLRSLVAPSLPQDKSFVQLVMMLKNHFEPKPLIIAERVHFHHRNQHLRESIADHAAELRRMSAKCEFNAFLDEALRDRFNRGIRNESTQKRLIAEKELTSAKAFDIAQTMETADQNARALKEPSASIQKVSNPERRLPCVHCRRKSHNSKDCHFQEANCHNCGKKGHIASACTIKKSARKRKHPHKQIATKWMNVNHEEDRLSTSDELNVFTVGEVLINDRKIFMAVDTCAAVSIISENTLKSVLPRVMIQPSAFC